MKIPKHFFFAKFFLVEGLVQGALRKELLIALSVNRFKTASCFDKALLTAFGST